MAKRQSSARASSIAARRLSGATLTEDEIDTLAGSVLAQDEVAGQAAAALRRTGMEGQEFVAAKPFNTVNRRIAAGEVVTRAEIEAGDRDFDAMRTRGFIVGFTTKAAERAAQKAKDSDGLILADAPDPTPPPEDRSPAEAPEQDKPAKPEIKRAGRRHG